MAIKLLLVEDEAVIAMGEMNMLESSGFTVEHVFTGEEAIRNIIEDNEISLILMDIDLGAGIDGTQAAKAILEIQELPIVFLTSHAEEEIVAKVKNITSYGYIIKNTGKFVLVESISMALNLFKAHTDLRKSEIEYREIVEGIESAILKFDSDGRIIYFSSGAEKIFGYSAPEVMGKLSVETINPELDSDGNHHEDMMKSIFKDTVKYTINENENRKKDGSILHMRWYNNAIYDHDGNQMYTLAIGEDITEKKKIFHQLSSANNLQNAFTYSPVMMTITTLLDGTYIEVNENFIKETGFSREECIGKTSTELGIIPTDIRKKYYEELSGDHDYLRFPIELRCKSGKLIQCIFAGLIIDIEKEKQLLSIVHHI